MKRPKPERAAEGQQSVWEYPRPPLIEPTRRRLTVVFNGETIAGTTRGIRVCETSHPPVYFFPREDVAMERLEEGAGGSFCEWKGEAAYFDVVVGDRRAERAAFSYPNPTREEAALRGRIAFYAGAMDGCFVDGERAEAQPGGFYAGWITSDLVGPFKGGPGTAGW